MTRANACAFPTHVGDPGLTIREYFAAMAMQGALGGTPGSHLIPENLARDSVAHADALLAALKEQL